MSKTHCFEQTKGMGGVEGFGLKNKEKQKKKRTHCTHLYIPNVTQKSILITLFLFRITCGMKLCDLYCQFLFVINDKKLRY